MSPKTFSLFAASLLALGVSAFGQAKPEGKPSSPASDFSKEAYVVEHMHTRVTGENDGTGTREVTAEIKVLADAGVKAFAVLNFVYTSANEVVDVDYVRVRKPDGTIVKTPDYNIQDMPGEVTRTAPLYSDIHEKHVAVKGLGVGDTLEYLIRSRTLKPEVPGHFWHEYSFTKKAVIKDEQLELSVPRDKYVKVVSPEFKPDVKEEGERKIYRWTYANLEAKPPDPDEIPRRTQPNPDVQITTFASWEDVGRWYGDLQKEPLTVTTAIQAKAAELTKGLKTNDEKVHALYNFVSLKFHYIGLDFGIGRYQPHAADDVLDNGYGDCKDKHTLLASLLKASGIEAWPILINASRKLHPDVPSPAQFNHVITYVNLPEPIFLDTTPEVAPYRLLLLMLRNKQALVVPTNKAPFLITTPETPPFPMDQEFSAEGKLNSEGTFTGHIEQSYRGDTEVVMRMAFRKFPESQWKDAVQRFSHGLNFGGDVSNVSVSSPDDLDKPLTISYDYVRKHYAGWDDGQTSPPLPPMGVEEYKNAKEKKPLESILLGQPGKIVYRARVELPPGYSVVPPLRCHEVLPSAEYSGNSVLEGGVLTTTRELIVKKTEVPLNDWESYRKFGRAVADDEYEYSLMRLNHNGVDIEANASPEATDEDEAERLDSQFRQANSALQNRDSARAQELFQKVIAKDPKRHGAHFGLAMALIAQFHVDDAIAEFHKEQELSPDDPRMYQYPAMSLAAMGRRNDALAEWRRLLKVDPKNRDAALGASGLLFAEDKFSEAADILEGPVNNEPEDAGMQLALGEAYLRSGSQEKALPHLRAAVEVQEDDPVMLNEVSYELADHNSTLDLAQEYGERAVNELEDEESKVPDGLRATFHEVAMGRTYFLSLTWDTLGWVYFQQGDFKRAEPFVRASWVLGEQAIVGKHLGQIYEKEGKKELAAQAYLNALTVSSGSTSALPIPQNDAMAAAQKEAQDLTARYEKVAGKKPELIVTHRQANGEWTKTPAEKLD
jgi:tetratricopeptide (TPR) repeat protein